MTARRGHSLNFETGIVAWIKDQLEKNDLSFAAIEGDTKEGQREKFSTSTEGLKWRDEIELDPNGQVLSQHIWQKLSEMIDSL